MIFCKHKFGKIEDGYQYCERCGKAIVAPCAHQWNLIQEATMKWFGTPTGKIIVQQCSRCGEIRKTDIGQTNGWW